MASSHVLIPVPNECVSHRRSMRAPYGAAALTGIAPMFFRQLRCGRVLMAFFAACALSIPTALHALSLDEAQRLATQTPSLKAEAAKIEAARNAAIPAAELPDPKLVL